MFRASVLALYLLVTPALAQEAPDDDASDITPTPFWFEQMAREQGTPDTHGADDEDDICVEADEGSCPEWVLLGYDYDADGNLEPWYFDNRYHTPLIVSEGTYDVPVYPETPLNRIPFVESRDNPEDEALMAPAIEDEAEYNQVIADLAAEFGPD